jgi:hypothetical protein
MLKDSHISLSTQSPFWSDYLGPRDSTARQTESKLPALPSKTGVEMYSVKSWLHDTELVVAVVSPIFYSFAVLTLYPTG